MHTLNFPSPQKSSLSLSLSPSVAAATPLLHHRPTAPPPSIQTIELDSKGRMQKNCWPVKLHALQPFSELKRVFCPHLMLNIICTNMNGLHIVKNVLIDTVLELGSKSACSNGNQSQFGRWTRTRG
ncbi:hypothetical protein CsSME_00016138 [Camellia sinensis var. sinensis]